MTDLAALLLAALAAVALAYLAGLASGDRLGRRGRGAGRLSPGLPRAYFGPERPPGPP